MLSAQHPVITGTPQIKDAIALQARTKSQQLKGSKGVGKKGKGGNKESTSSSQPAKESADSNPHTKALVEKKAKETGESASEIRKKIKCHNCGKAGHISTDCKKEKTGKPQKGKSNNKGVASQGVVFCATCDSDNDEDYPVDAEGVVEFDVMDDSEQMPELIRDDDDDSVVATEPPPSAPAQLSVFAALYPLPPVLSSESTWASYNWSHSHLINRHFRNWLTYQRNSYRWNQLPGGPVMYDSSRLSESENEAIWQADKRRLSDRIGCYDASIPRVLPARVGGQKLLRRNVRPIEQHDGRSHSRAI